MGFYDWMLALHLLAAFAVAAALVLFSVLVVAGRRMETLEQTRLLFRLAPVGNPLIGVGMGLTLLLGIVLAIDSDDYQLWDVWVILALVLWALMGWVGQRTGRVLHARCRSLRRAGTPAPRPRCSLGCGRRPVRACRPQSVVVFVLIVLDMIFKPWA